MGVCLFLCLFLCGCRYGDLIVQSCPSPLLPHLLVVWPHNIISGKGGLGSAGGVGGRVIEGGIPRSLGAILGGGGVATVGGVGQCYWDSFSVREI